MVARAVAAVALATVAMAGMVSAQNTFCEYYTGALFTNATDPTQQLGLVSAVVSRAAVGLADPAVPSAGKYNNVTGLFNDPLNKGYFNGTLPPRINYMDAAQSSTLSALVLHLNQFFMTALGCRNGAAVNPWNPTPRGTMKSLHAAMNINAAIMTSFVNQVAASLTSYGVDLTTTGVASELAYVQALFSQFNRYTTVTDSNSFSICTQSDCPIAQQNVQFHVNADGSVVGVGLNGAATSVTINSGDYVNFRFPAAGGITQTSSGSSTTSSGSMSSASGTHTYTTQMNTPGTYYWYSNALPSNGRIQVTVTATPSSSTGSSSMSSTATGGAAATASLGFAAVLAVAAAAAAVVA